MMRRNYHIILVRHGQPREVPGDPAPDPPLSERGQMQARIAAERLVAEGVDRLVASPLRRAQQTAAPLAAACGLPVITIDGLAEVDRDGERYRSTEAVRAAGADHWQQFLDDPFSYFGVDQAAFSARVWEGLTQAMAGAPDKLALFTHGLPISIVLTRTLGLSRFTLFAPRFCSFTRLVGPAPDRLSLVSLNETGHFPADAYR